MRVLHVISSVAAGYGGPSKAVLEMCRELGRRDVAAEIYTTDVDVKGRLAVPLRSPIDLDGARITYFPMQALNSFKVSLPLAAALRDTVARFDVVHVHSLYQFPASVAAFHCRRQQVPYVIRPHGTLDPFIFRHHRARKWIYESLCERRNLAGAAAVHFTSEDEKHLAQGLGLQFESVVIPLGVAADELAIPVPQLCSLWPETSGKRVILYLGRLNFKKGLDILSCAFGEIARTRSDVHLLLAGPDHEGYGKRVKRWLAAEGVLDRVTLCGMLTGTAKQAALRGASIFVLPSYSENFGIAVVEAMAAGLPVVISNKVNIWREVEEAGAGIVVDPQPHATAEALTALLEHPQRALAMGARGRKLARDRFSWQSAGAALVELYRAISNPRRDSTGAQDRCQRRTA